MNAPLSTHPTPPYKHSPLFPLGKDTAPYRKISSDGLRVEKVMGEEVLVVPREALRALAEAAFTDIAHLLRPAHLASLKSIVEDPEASDNDKFVAFDFLKNANIAAGGVLPMCQDTGTALIMAKKGRLVWTDGSDEGALAEGARDAYLKRNLRYSQLAPISMFEEKNTKNNMPAQVEIFAEGHNPEHPDYDAAYKFLFIAKAVARPTRRSCSGDAVDLPRDRLLAFLKRRCSRSAPRRARRTISPSSSAAPRPIDDEDGEARFDQILRHTARPRLRRGHAFRDKEIEQEILKMTQSLGVGARFGGKFFSTTCT